MPLDIIKDIWEYTTSNKSFLLIIMVLFLVFCLLIEIFDEMGMSSAFFLLLIPYSLIGGYGMTITKDVINDGKRLPKILIKDVILLGIKSTVIFNIYVFVQEFLFSSISHLCGFPVINVEDLVLDFFKTVPLLFNHDLVNTIIFLVIDFVVFYCTMFFMEIALAKLADTGSILDALNLKSIKETIDLIGWGVYAKHYTVIILLLGFFSLMMDIDLPIFVLDYVFKLFLGLLLFTTQYWGIGTVYRIFKEKQSSNLHQ